MVSMKGALLWFDSGQLPVECHLVEDTEVT